MRCAGSVDPSDNIEEQSLDGFYAAVSDCARARLIRSVDLQAVEDYVQEVLIIVMAAVRSGQLRDPRCIMGFVRTVTRRQVAGFIHKSILERNRMVCIDSARPTARSGKSPEEQLVFLQEVSALKELLQKICDRDREILIRYYYEEQKPEEICIQMKLTATQFRLFKSRALAKCLQLTRREDGSIHHAVVNRVSGEVRIVPHTHLL